MDQTLLERVNPVFNTAKMTVFQLAKSGDKYSAKIAEKLGVSFEETQNSATSKASPEQITAGIIMMEMRFRTIAKMIEKSGYHTVVDLPCGYTPRAIYMADTDKEYYGLDLPVAVSEAELIIRALADEDKQSKIHYSGVDATNLASLKKALENVNEPVCITTEGLLMYFTDSEVSVLCDNIRQILNEKGGCWLIADPEAAFQYILTIQPLCGDRFMEIMMNSKKNVQDKSGVEVGKNTLILNARKDPSEEIKKAMMFLASHGLKAERLSVGEYLPEIANFTTIPAEQAAMIKENMNKSAYWKVTPIGKSAELDTSDLKDKSFDVQASAADDKLTIKLIGRVDTLTVPHLLTLYERVTEQQTIHSVDIDCSELEYISSAGLRVMMIMTKRSKDGVKLEGINDTVKEILEQTGFDSILEIVD